MYQSENKHESYENHLIHGFVNLSIGKPNMKKFEEYHFLTQKAERLRPKSLFRKNMIISFCIIFLKNLSRVMRHKKSEKFKKKTKNCQNHEGSYNLGKTFWNPKKLLISSIGKKYQLCALLESGIGGLMFCKLFKNVKKQGFVFLQTFTS